MPKTRVFTFGCPHSGTTFLWRMMRDVLQHDDTCEVFRLREGPLHPINSDVGLHGLAYQFSDIGDRVVFVRIVRDPVQIFESFAAKALRPNGTAGVTGDEEVFRCIRNERFNTRAQLDSIMVGSRIVDMHVVTFRYEDMQAAVMPIESKLGVGRAVTEYLAEHWMQTPSRVGRLSMGIKESLLTPERIAWIESVCAGLPE